MRSLVLFLTASLYLACAHPRAVNHVTSSSTIQLVHLHDLTVADGYRVRSKLIDGHDGKLYGSAWHGGSNGCGTLFAFDLALAKYVVLHDFSALDSSGRNDDGCGPIAHVSLYGGRLWVVTPRGGRGGNPIRAGVGVIASMMTDGSDYRVEHQVAYPWPSTEGGSAQGALEWDEARGVAFLSMSGSIWKFDPTAQNLTRIYTFPARLSDGTNAIGSNPYGSPVPYDGGELGWTLYGGPFGAGGIYFLDPDKGTARLVYAFPRYSFSGNSDNTPLGSPYVAPDGSAYVAVEFGGLNGSGLFVKVERTGTVVHEFGIYPYAVDGALPIGEVVIGADGRLHGTTMYGARGYGLLWSVGLDGRGFTTDVILSYPDLCYPYAGLTNVDGKLYGVTGGCGSAGGGSVIGVVQ